MRYHRIMAHVAESGTIRVRTCVEGVHLFDRRSGWNLLLDEVPTDPANWARAPRYMSIALTNACELSCPYCYASKVPARQRADEVSRWARELGAAGGLGVGFGGGEPSLFPAFTELCHRVRTETELAITFTTHAHRFNPNLVAKLSGAVDFIRVSMDGVGATYERLRGRPFAEFRKKLMLVGQTAGFGINMVINRDTIGDLPEAASFAISERARELLLLPETGPNGRICCDAVTLSRASEWIAANQAQVRLATSDHAVDALGAPRLPIASADPSMDFMHIDAFGTLKFGAFELHGTKLEAGAPLLPAIETLREKRHAAHEQKMEIVQ